MRLSQKIIKHAKRLYPISLHYRGQFTDKQYNEIEKQCEIHCSNVYMDGSRIYCIRYKAESKVEDGNEKTTVDE